MSGPINLNSNLNKAERIAYIDDKLQSLYPTTPVPLDHTDPYTLLIAVLLSAQSRSSFRQRRPCSTRPRRCSALPVRL